MARPVRLPYEFEDTGLNRMLGSVRDDRLYGGTVLDFMYGHAGNDDLYGRHGALFEDKDSALADNDHVTVGRTVQKTVWIDAGPGDNVAQIMPGEAILADLGARSGTLLLKVSTNLVPTCYVSTWTATARRRMCRWTNWRRFCGWRGLRRSNCARPDRARRRTSTTSIACLPGGSEWAIGLLESGRSINFAAAMDCSLVSTGAGRGKEVSHRRAWKPDSPAG